MFLIVRPHLTSSFFFFNDTATTEIYTLSLHDALPISHVLVGERGAIAEGTQENRPDRHTAPRDRHHRDGLHAAADELALHVLQTRVGGRVGDEHRLAALHRAFQLGVALQVHHVVANGGILVGRDQPHGPAAPLGEKDRAAVQPERLAQRSEEHTSELQSQSNLVCRLLLEKKKKTKHY